MRILQQAFRIYVDTDALDATVAFYEQAQGMKCERRVMIVETGVVAAKVGGFLILSGRRENLAPVRDVYAIFYVDSLDAFVPWLRDKGAEISCGAACCHRRSESDGSKSGWPRCRIFRGDALTLISNVANHAARHAFRCTDEAGDLAGRDPLNEKSIECDPSSSKRRA